MPDLREGYGYKDNRPFGASIAYDIISRSFPQNSIQVQKKSFFDHQSFTNDSTALYINISNKYFVNARDANTLMDFVYRGNIAFISAAEIDTILLDKLYYKQQTFSNSNPLFSDFYADTHVQLVPAVRSIQDSLHSYFYSPFVNYFSELRNAETRIVGYNQNNKPDFVVFFFGKGRLFLHSNPRAFSNYFLLTRNNYQYLLQPLQIMPEHPQRIFWDDYYNKLSYRDDESKSSFLSAIFRNPPLKWAFWLLLAMLLLFIFINGKRRQRNIPIIKPVQNSSVAFAEAIAGLYFKEKNNKTISEKMITYFNEFIRSKYFLNSTSIDQDFLITLSKKAGVSLEQAQKLFGTIQQQSQDGDITDQQLLDLNNQIQQFIKPNN